MTNTKAFVIISLFLVLLVFFAVGPFFTIWSLNTLFGLQIEMNFKNWVAVVWLLTIFHGIKLVLNKEQ